MALRDKSEREPGERKRPQGPRLEGIQSDGRIDQSRTQGREFRERRERAKDKKTEERTLNELEKRPEDGKL